jgi:ribosomal protein S18 acetylase RimI-like enzyme
MRQPPSPPFAVRRLGESDAAAFRALRLEALAAHPEAFGASWEVEAEQPPACFAERLARNAVFGGEVGDAGLAGVAAFAVPEAPKLRHKGVLWGMYVRPEARGTGLASALVARVLDHARGAPVEEVRLSVVASNAAAVRLYESAGFAAYGRERRALRVGDAYHDEVLMARRLDD